MEKAGKHNMKDKIIRGVKRSGIFVGMATVVLLAGIITVLFLGIQSVLGLINKLLN